MGRGFLACVAFLASVGGRVDGPAEDKRAGLEEGFALRIGESALIQAEALRIGFDDVPTDSRCPKGEQCVREGDATVRVSVQKASRAKEKLELHTSAREQGAADYLDYTIRLLRLDPHPVSGKAIERGDYVATLEVARGSSAISALLSRP